MGKCRTQGHNWQDWKPLVDEIHEVRLCWQCGCWQKKNRLTGDVTNYIDKVEFGLDNPPVS